MVSFSIFSFTLISITIISDQDKLRCNPGCYFHHVDGHGKEETTVDSKIWKCLKPPEDLDENEVCSLVHILVV